MNRFIVVLLLAVSSAGGCVSSSQFEEMRSEMQSLALQNRALQLQLQARSDARPAPAAEPAEPETDQPVVSERQPAPAPAPTPAPERRPVARRPIGPAPAHPPQHWARMYGEPGIPGCDGGPLSVQVQNQTGHYIRLFLDGVESRQHGGAGVLPHLPPGQTTFLCLRNPGRHNLSGVVYARRGNQMVELERFSLDRHFTPGTVSPSRGHQFVRINRQFLLFH